MRTGRLCAVNTTVSSARGAAARTRSANASSSSGCAWYEVTASNCTPAGSAAVAASTYFCTLSVENCGAIGTPTTRVAPARASSSSASLMNGRQLRMPTATGTPPPSRARSASACAIVRSVSGERPPIAA